MPDVMPFSRWSESLVKMISKNLGRLNGGREYSTAGSRSRKAVSDHSKPILDPEPSAALCDHLAVELGEINSTEEAANWAHRVLGAKNNLTAADAAYIEEAFRAKVAMIATDTADGPEIPQEPKRLQTRSRSDRGKRRSSVIDKSALALPEPRRVRDRDHVRYVAQQSCLICGRRPSDAHHLRFAQNRALSRKVSDEFTVPLCRGHHREVHHSGDEGTWWTKAEIDPMAAARALWLETHPLPAISDKARVDEPSSVVANNSDRRKVEHDRPSRKRGRNYKTWR
jgi:hypothetical protein